MKTGTFVRAAVYYHGHLVSGLVLEQLNNMFMKVATPTRTHICYVQSAIAYDTLTPDHEQIVDRVIARLAQESAA